MPRAQFLVVALLFAGALSPADASGHAAFVGSSPAAGARLQSAPPSIELRFTEPLDRNLSTVRLMPAVGGDPVVADVSATGDRRVELRPRETLKTGAYVLEWHTVSTEDGHALEGSFSFGLRSAATGASHTLEQSPLVRGGALRVAARLAMYAFALMLAAALMLPVLLRRRDWVVPSALERTLDIAAVRRHETRVVRVLITGSVVASAVTMTAEAADAASGLAPARLADFFTGSPAGALRAGVVIAFATIALVWPRRPRLAALAVILAFAGFAGSGHASSADPRFPSILNDWLHLISGAVWLGGTAVIVVTLWPALRRSTPTVRLAVAREVLPTFGRVALPAFVAVTLTGLLALVTQLGHVSALWTTGYGRVLAVKVFLVGVVAAISAYHALRLRPRLASVTPRTELRHWRLLRSEPMVAILIVLAVATLVSFPLPPRQLGDVESAGAAVNTCDPCPLPRPSANELPVAHHVGSQLVAAWIRRGPNEVTGVIRSLGFDQLPAGPVDVLGARTTPCGEDCRRFSLPATATHVRVAAIERGKRYVTTLPARWHPRSDRRARKILRRAEDVMRDLRGVRQREHVTSGPGSRAVTEYKLRAPDRMRLRTDRGLRTIIIGRRQWQRTPEASWLRSRYGAGLPFRTRSWFRWSTYARAARILSIRRRSGRRVATLALMDEATPVWFRLSVDLRTGRVLREQMMSRGHFMQTSYSGFDHAYQVDPPKESRVR